MIRLLSDDDNVSALSSTPNDLTLTVTAISVSGADVTDISETFTDTFGTVGILMDGDHGGDRVDITGIVLANPADSGVTPRVKITETISDVTVTIFQGLIPPGYAAVLQPGNVFVVMPTATALPSGAVSKLIAGTDNVSLSPADGTGNVSVSVAGDGQGDMLSTNNLSDVEDVDSSVSNLGLATAKAAALSAVQPGDLATIATTGNYSDLNGKPTLGTAAATDSTAYATAAQGAKADTALQTAGRFERTDIAAGVQTLTNTTGFTLTAAQLINQAIALTGAPAGDINVQLPTAAAILAGITAPKVGDNFWFVLWVHTFGGHNCTLTVNTGVTYFPAAKWSTGNAYNIGPNNERWYRGIVTNIGSGTEAVHIIVDNAGDWS